MIKLNYKTTTINGLCIQYAKYRKNKNLRLSIDNNGIVKVTAPYFCDTSDIFDFVLSKETWIKNIIKKQSTKKVIGDSKSLKTKDKKMLLDRILTYIKKYELLMNTYVNNITLRNMKSVWGSCTYKRHDIRFNTKLYFMSDYFLEYIVVHEMAHIFVPNHSKDFYAIVSKYLPDYKKRWREHKNIIIN